MRLPCKNGNTPLHWAVFNSELKIVKKLVSCGSDITNRNIDGEKPIHLVPTDESMEKADFEITKFLMTQEVSLEDSLFYRLSSDPMLLFCTNYETGDMYLHRFIQICADDKDSGSYSLKKFLENIIKFCDKKYLTPKEMYWLFTQKNKCEGTIFHMVFYKECYDLALVLLDFFRERIVCSPKDKVIFLNQRNFTGRTVHSFLKLCKNTSYEKQQKKDFNECLERLSKLK